MRLTVYYQKDPIKYRVRREFKMRLYIRKESIVTNFIEFRIMGDGMCGFGFLVFFQEYICFL